MLGYVALNAAEGLTPSIQWHELEAELEAGATLVDVRTAARSPTAIPVGLHPARRNPDAPGRARTGRLIVRKVGQRGHTAVRLLAQLGREAVNLDGGYLTSERRLGNSFRGSALVA